MGASFWHCGHLQALQEGALRSATPFVDTGLQVGVRRDERPVKGRVLSSNTFTSVLSHRAGAYLALLGSGVLNFSSRPCF